MASLAIDDRFDALYWDYLQAKQLSKKYSTKKEEAIVKVAWTRLTLFLERYQEFKKQAEGLEEQLPSGRELDRELDQILRDLLV